MPTCPHCREEYSPDSAKFCNRCGVSFGDMPAAVTTQSDMVEPEGQPVAAEQMSGTSGPAVSQPVATLGSPIGGDVNVQTSPVGDGGLSSEAANDSGGDTTNKNIITGEGNIGQQNITNITTTEVKFCAAGNEELSGNRQLFKCPECNRQPVCDRHFDDSRNLCELCVQRQKEKAIEMTELLSDDTTVIVGGEVVPRSTVKLVGGRLVSEDGRMAAEMKPQTFYARPKQWFRVKPKRLKLEQQAMHQLHPHMQIGMTDEGDCCWDGIVKVRSGNEYQIHLLYPHRFPFAPPKAFVINPKIERSRHIYDDGHLCLFHKDDAAWQTNTTAAVVMSWVSLWLHCYEVWKETGEWVRKEADQVVISPTY